MLYWHIFPGAGTRPLGWEAWCGSRTLHLSERICCCKIPLACETKTVGPNKAMSLPLLSWCGFSLYPQLQRFRSLVLRLFTEIIALSVQLILEQHSLDLYRSTYTQFIFNWPTHFQPELFKSQLAVGNLHMWNADLVICRFLTVWGSPCL